ncbi:MAG: hypothetical protein MI739_07720, partial [Bacteroidales bacterium]|nr:hypothetical protein [Bacteroidales bacterium]
DTLFLNANINVTGTGFRGATPILTNIECGITSPSIYRSYYFDESTTLSTGFKGESIAKFESGYRKGLGRWANGGGAANGRFSGAGGGGNGGNGGVGGSEDITVCNQNVFRLIPPSEQRSIGGDDGFGLSLRVNSRTIFLGGGGGAGTYASSFVASNGGNGGGIVIIIASNIKTSGYQIRANGSSVSEYTPTPFNISNISTASAGGGGGGGAIVFDVDTVLGSLSLIANGGGGAFVQNTNIAGPGGGGGGGIVFWKTNRPDNVNISINGGSSGFVAAGYPGSEDNYNASEGGVGSTYLNTMVPLTGFLFNRISQGQDICTGMTPSIFEGSTLRGGTGTYTYQWQNSTDGVSWSNITGATEPNYQAPSLTDTTYYRRVATSGTIIDRGNVIRINVQNLITNNI